MNQTFLLTLSKLASQAALITIRMSLLRSTMHVLHHIRKKLSRAKINNWMMIRSLLIINQFLLLKEFSRNGKEKAKYIRPNGSAIQTINQPGNRRKIFWMNVLSNILSMAKSEFSENLVCGMSESQFSIFFICVNGVPAQPRNINQQINCAFIGHNKPDFSFVTFINLFRGSAFVFNLSDNEFIR